MDQAQTALYIVAAVETSINSCQELDEGGIEGGARLLLGLQPAGAVVEQWFPLFDFQTLQPDFVGQNIPSLHAVFETVIVEDVGYRKDKQ